MNYPTRIYTVKTFITTLLIALFALAIQPALAPAAHAQSATTSSVMQADQLLSSWQMQEAHDVIQNLATQFPDTVEVLYLQARYDFYQGNYQQALKKIDAAIAKGSPRQLNLKELREIINNTLNVTKPFERHLSPSGRFEIFIEPGRDRVLLPYAFEALDLAYDALAEELGYRPPTPVRVEIYPKTAVLAEVTTLSDEEIRTSGTIAICQYNRLMITSPRALLRGYGWVDTLIHEYVHYIVNQKAANRVPIWMHEGLAKYLERRWRGPDQNQISLASEQLLHERLKADTLIPFEAMHPSMAKLPSQEDAAVAFAEVYTVMEYLREKVGPGAFAKVLDTINLGHDAQTAFAMVLGTTFKEFEKDWKVFLKTRPKPNIPDDADLGEKLVFKDDSSAAGELSQIAQPQARDHINLGELLHARERYAAATVQYEKASQLLGTHNPILQTRLAQTLQHIGRHKDAITALLEVRDLHPGYVNIWLELGRASNALNDHKNARDYLLEAARINPFHPDVHHELAIAYDKLDHPELAKRERDFVQIVR